MRALPCLVNETGSISTARPRPAQAAVKGTVAALPTGSQSKLSRAALEAVQGGAAHYSTDSAGFLASLIAHLLACALIFLLPCLLIWSLVRLLVPFPASLHDSLPARLPVGSSLG